MNSNPRSAVGFIGLRFNARRTLPRSIRIMRAVAVAGIAVGVAALVVAVSIGRGFEGKYRKALLDFNAHVVVMGGGEMNGAEEVIPSVASLAPDAADRGSGLFDSLLGAARRVSGAASGLHGRISILLMDSGRLRDAWDALDPARLESFLPESLSRLAEKSDERKSRGVVAWTPFLYREALALGGGKISGVVIKGVDPATMPSVNAMPVTIFRQGSGLAEALSRGAGEPPRVVAGRALAEKLGAGSGEKRVKLLVPREEGRTASADRFDEILVVGTFESGMHDYDAQFMLMSLPETRSLFRVPGETITGLELKLDDPDKAQAVAARLEETLGPGFGAVTWSELNRELLTAVKLEQLVSALVMGIMVVVAALNIVAVLVLMTIYRFHEISVLKALGLKNRQVASLLTMGGASVGFYGAAAGLLLGAAAALLLGRPGVVPLEAEVYLIGALPIDISPLICGMIALFCLGVGFLTSRFAAKRLSEVPIAEGLRIAR